MLALTICIKRKVGRREQRFYLAYQHLGVHPAFKENARILAENMVDERVQLRRHTGKVFRKRVSWCLSTMMGSMARVFSENCGGCCKDGALLGTCIEHESSTRTGRICCTDAIEPVVLVGGPASTAARLEEPAAVTRHD